MKSFPLTPSKTLTSPTAVRLTTEAGAMRSSSGSITRRILARRIGRVREVFINNSRWEELEGSWLPAPREADRTLVGDHAGFHAIRNPFSRNDTRAGTRQAAARW